jgi:UDP-apiose/xylose synthase
MAVSSADPPPGAASALPGRIAVLGGGGFLGSHLTAALLDQGAHVVILDRCFDKLGRRTIEHTRLHCVAGSVDDAALLEAALHGCDVVVSMTALCNPSLYNKIPQDVIRANFLDLLPLVELCARKRCWLVHLSTCEVYGRGDPSALLQEDSTPLVLGPVQSERWSYACAKQLLERWIWAQGIRGALPFTIVRPFNIIGPRMDYLPGIDGEGIPRVLACFMAALLRQEPLPLVDGGQQRRTFTSARDFCDAMLAILRAPGRCQGEIFNLGNAGNDVSIAELARQMIAVYAARHGGDPALPCRPISAQSYYGLGYDDVARRIPDLAHIEARVGWRARISLAEMLPEIVDDYVARYRDRVADGSAQAAAAP